MTDPVQRCLAGIISPQIAIMHLLLAGNDAAGIRAKVSAARPDVPTAEWQALYDLLAGRDADLDGLAVEIRAIGSDHNALPGAATDPVARVAAFFDRAAQYSPEAGVALYSLGDPVLLAQATAEIGDWLVARNLLHDGDDVLDLGCGIGRLAPTLAARARSVIGLDVSANMVAQARDRIALPNVRFEQASGHDLDQLAADSLDLILAVDSFPYIVAAGPEVLRSHLDGARRALRPGGSLVVLNFSYRADRAADEADARSSRGLVLDTVGEASFRIWDAAAYVWHRPAIEVVRLADRPDLASVIACWLWHEFQSAFESLEQAEAIVAAGVARHDTPQTFVALDGAEPVGTASFADSDLDERLDLTPWLAGVFVLPSHRGIGVATRLVRAVEGAARQSGHAALWLYTVEARAFYSTLGWHAVEQVTRVGRKSVSLMSRSLG